MDYEIQTSEIRRLLLLKFKIKAVTPRDCENISVQINKCVSKYISVTTLKRLFGLAIQKYNFSTFTLFTLSEFLNIEYPHKAVHTTIYRYKNNKLTKNKSKAFHITAQTLEMIHTKCGIPYEMTTSRKFAEDDFKSFYESSQIFTSLVSPSGYGKSILLSHLAENLFTNANAVYQKSTLLFIRANDFFLMIMNLILM